MVIVNKLNLEAAALQLCVNDNVLAHGAYRPGLVCFDLRRSGTEPWAGNPDYGPSQTSVKEGPRVLANWPQNLGAPPLRLDSHDV